MATLKEKQNGGKRAGAGRPRGSKNKRPPARLLQTKAKLEELNADGVTPIEVLTDLMRECYRKGKDEHDLKMLEKAGVWAEKAAPYFHPKLQSVEHGGDKERPLSFKIISGVLRDVEYDSDDDEHGINGSH